MSSGKRTRKTIFSDSEVEEDTTTATNTQRQTRAGSKRARRSVTEEIRAFPDFPDDMEVTAESGVIEYIELVHFMCHKFLKVNFGPKINFIIGHNGSGKSAILTGITVCLGGKANATNRASNLKSLIREGANVGQITLKLRNRGSDAYRHDIYGDSIIVERRISRDGSNGYKIKTCEGKVVSGKREELNSILDHMAIQVDNPMNVLSQDTARQFLQSSSPEDKYKFFMKGTQLTQLSEDYELIRESIDTTQNIIKNKKEVLPYLHKQAREAEARFKDMEKARELEVLVSSLKDQIAWAQVEEKEKEVVDAEKNLQRVSRRIVTVQANLDKEKMELDKINAAITELEQQYNQHVEAAQPLQNRKKELQTRIREKTNQLREISADEREINENIGNLRQSIETYQVKIEEETRKLQENNRLKRDDTLNAIKIRENEVERLSQLNHELQTKLENLHEKRDHIRNEKYSIENNIRNSREQILHYENLKQQLEDQKINRLKAFGPSIPDVLQAIDQVKSWNRKPIGPFGKYVSLKMPEWCNTLESVLNTALTAFAVYDNFDYSVGEPDREFLTILRVLQINDENVKRRLITQYHIESTILIENRAEADRIMYNEGKGFPRNVDGSGGYSTQSIRTHRGPPILAQDIDAQIRDATRRHRDASLMHARYLSESSKADSELNNVIAEQKQIQSETTENQRRGRELNDEIIQLKDKLQDEEPANIAALEDAVREAEQQITQYKINYSSLQEQKISINQEQVPLVHESEKVSDRLVAMAEESHVINRKFEEQVSLRVTYANNKAHWEAKLAVEQEKIDSADKELKDKKITLEDWTKQAVDYCPERVEVTKSAHDLDREIKQIGIRLHEREREHGVSLEEIASDMKARRDAYRNAKREIEHMERFLRDLKVALQSRMLKWRNFRTYISLRARSQFSFQLSKRGYAGKLAFDHKLKKLTLRVQVDEQTNQCTDKDPKSLSGGEKSFSTICLLLALWEAMGCPIRCLDEFDVFMDAVNRRISMRMMIETAREADCTQYILITPQDASSVSPGPDVRVHRLQDPERGQGILDETNETN
ncbi:9168_t:CDS:10 [Diversispora eburnea]|uniref:9168_t:CDS:1 n=1 Tax=Diversispora eburnea TaxID=1213867 RepID=A0A9N8VAG1_9GLOM|nr:9168_t:CDS:10 [Diversispora eburnea]